MSLKYKKYKLIFIVLAFFGFFNPLCFLTQFLIITTMRNRVLIKVGLILEFLAELLYFIAIVYPRYFSFILVI
jgi:hypothetical protein